MAERRMFTKKITDDERFYMLPASTQLLYFHLSMSADDDGFCNQVSVAMFKAHASLTDLETLLDRRYLYQFENGVIVIKHWRMANALRKDRYTPTVFQEELAKLCLKDNGSYTWLPNGCQMVAVCPPQDRLGKDSIDNNNILSDKQKAQLADNMTPITLEVVTYLNEKANTNFKPCTDKTKRCIKARVNEGFTLEDFKKVIDKKVNSWMGTEWQKYLRPETLFGTKFEGYLNETNVKPKGNSFNQMIHTDYDFDEIEKQILK